MRYDRDRIFGEGVEKMRRVLWVVAVSGCFAAESGELSVSMKAMQKACERHVATACYEFGILYEEGIGVNKDIEKAMAYYRQACEDGYDKACTSAKRVQADM
jgi:TPR repeat protein